MASPIDIAQDGNLFPREQLLEAAAGADWRDQGVPTRAWAAASLGVALLAAGLPNLRTLYTAPTAFAATGDYMGLHPIHLLARALGSLGLGIEATFFWISALSLGAAMVALGVALRAFGFAGRTAFPIALLTCLSQTLTEHARLPSDYLPGVCSSGLLLAAMAMPKDPGETGLRGYAVRISAVWLLACWVSKDALALFPVLVIACAGAPTEGPRGRKWIMPLALAAGFAALLAVPGIFGNDPGDRPIPGAHPHSGIDGMITLWALWPLALLSMNRSPEELPAPRWVTAWFFLGAAWSLLGIFWLPSSPTFLAPIVACMAANGLVRIGDSLRAGKMLVMCFTLQIVTAGTFFLLGPGSGRYTGPLAEGPGQLRPGDAIVLDPAEHPELAYLLRRRHGFEVIETKAPTSLLAEDRNTNGRLVELPGQLGQPRHLRATHRLIESSGEVDPAPETVIDRYE